MKEKDKETSVKEHPSLYISPKLLSSTILEEINFYFFNFGFKKYWKNSSFHFLILVVFSLVNTNIKEIFYSRAFFFSHAFEHVTIIFRRHLGKFWESS